MGKGNIPDRWLNYKPIGKIINGTRFIAFKVPLKQHISETVDDRENRLDDKILLQAIPNLGLIIDLTNTYKYYDPLECFEKNGIKHIKIMIPGHVVPDLQYRNKFKEAVNNFLEINENNDKLIGVHCTHGVNRTGFLICNYMVYEMNVKPEDALQRFAIARGHPIERENYKEFIKQMVKSSNDNITTINYNSKLPRIEVPLTKNNYRCDYESCEQNSTNNSYSRPEIRNNSWRECEPLPPRNNSWTERELLPPRNNSWRERESLPTRNNSWRERESLQPRNNSWRERELQPPGAEPYQVIRDHSQKRKYQDIDQKSKYSWRSQTTSINSSSVSSSVSNSYQEIPQKNCNYLSQDSNHQPNNTERITSLINNTAQTLNRDNYYVNSNRVYRAKSLNNHSNPYDKVTDRFERNPKGSNYRIQHTPKYDSKNDTKSVIYGNYDNKPKLEHRRKDPSQRTSMLDNLY